MLSEASQKFNQYLIESPELQRQLTSIKSPLDLINFAKEEGFSLPEFLTKSAIAKRRSLTGSGFEQSDRRFPQPTVCCQILS